MVVRAEVRDPPGCLAKEISGISKMQKQGRFGLSKTGGIFRMYFPFPPFLPSLYPTFKSSRNRFPQEEKKSVPKAGVCEIIVRVIAHNLQEEKK